MPDEQSPEVGGLQNTVTNLGASLGTALVGSVLIAALTALPGGDRGQPRRSRRVAAQGQVELAGGVPFVSDTDLKAALDEAGVRGPGGRDRRRERGRRDAGLISLSVLALAAVIALFLTRLVPTEPVGGGQVEESVSGPPEAT